MFKKIGLLVRLDIKVLMNSPWTYILLFLCALNVSVFYYAQPENKNTRIIVVDEMKNLQTEKMIQALLDEDYIVEKTDEIEPALKRVKKQDAFSIFHIDKNSNMKWLTATPGSSNIIRKLLCNITNSRKFDIEKSIARSKKLTMPDIPIIEDDISQGRSVKDESLAYIGVWVIWFICAIWTLTLLVNLKDSYFKLARKYTGLEVFLSKVISGLIFGTVLSILCWGVGIILGVRYSSILALVYCSFWAALLGVLFGILAAVIPLSAKTDMAGIVLMGIIMIFAFFSVMVDGCAPFTSMSVMPESIQRGAMWNFLFLLDTLAMTTIFSEDGLFTLQVQVFTRQLAFIAFFQALGCMIFLNKR